MTPDELLVRLVARVDAIFRPHRRTGDNQAAAYAIAERRAEYRDAGIRLATVADSRRCPGAVAELVAAGHILTRQGTHLRVSLTPAGDDRARYLARTPSLARSWPLLMAVDLFTATGMTNGGCVLEHDLCGVDSQQSHGSRTFWPLAYLGAPLLATGYLASAGDLQMHVGYRITPAGRAALAAGCPEPIEHTGPDLSALYDSVFTSIEVERDGWTPTADSSVAVPLSAGMWPKQRDVPSADEFRAWLQRELV